MKKPKRSRRAASGKARRRARRSPPVRTSLPRYKPKLPFYANKRLFYIIGIVALVGGLVLVFPRSNQRSISSTPQPTLPISVILTPAPPGETPTPIPTPAPSPSAP